MSRCVASDSTIQYHPVSGERPALYDDRRYGVSISIPPAAPKVEEVVEEEELAYSELADARLACPRAINGAMIPGTVHPFHTTYIGSYLNLLQREVLLGSSPKGVPGARYKIPEGPWDSVDGQIRILRGTVDGYCWYRATRFRIAVGSLHVYGSDVEFYEVPKPPEPRRPPESSPCGDAIIEDPDGGSCDGGGGGSTGGETVTLSGPPSGGANGFVSLQIGITARMAALGFT